MANGSASQVAVPRLRSIYFSFSLFFFSFRLTVGRIRRIYDRPSYRPSLRDSLEDNNPSQLAYTCETPRQSPHRRARDNDSVNFIRKVLGDFSSIAFSARSVIMRFARDASSFLSLCQQHVPDQVSHSGCFGRLARPRLSTKRISFPHSGMDYTEHYFVPL